MKPNQKTREMTFLVISMQHLNAQSVAGKVKRSATLLAIFIPTCPIFSQQKSQRLDKNSSLYVSEVSIKPKIFNIFNGLSIINYWHNSCSKMIGYFQAARTSGIKRDYVFWIITLICRSFFSTFLLFPAAKLIFQEDNEGVDKESPWEELRG